MFFDILWQAVYYMCLSMEYVLYNYIGWNYILIYRGNIGISL